LKNINKFWELNLNPITGWKKSKAPKKTDHSVKGEIKRGDQQTLFKPKGFR